MPRERHGESAPTALDRSTDLEIVRERTWSDFNAADRALRCDRWGKKKKFQRGNEQKWYPARYNSRPNGHAGRCNCAEGCRVNSHFFCHIVQLKIKFLIERYFLFKEPSQFTLKAFHILGSMFLTRRTEVQQRERAIRKVICKYKDI